MSEPRAETAVNELTAALADFFDPAEVKWKAQAVSGNRALAVAYVDARVVMDRLDEVLGPENWSDDYEVLASGEVVCRLRVRLGSEWITKVDVGGQSEQKDDGDRIKSAFSDGLKRAAVKFGIGRYLYRLPHQWVDYDQQKKQLAKTPTLPASAMPGARKALPKPKTPAAPRNGNPATVTPPAQKKGKPAPPKDGRELRERVLKLDATLTEKGITERGQLTAALDKWAGEQKLTLVMDDWSPEAVDLATAKVKELKDQFQSRREVVA